MTGSTRCPTCGATAMKVDNKVFPFCCSRCHLVDLGRWLAEDYRIPAEPADPALIPAAPDED